MFSRSSFSVKDQSAFYEPLEPRRLLASWGAFPQLIGQDAAVRDFPNITGAGESIAIIDSGVDYNHPALGGGFGPGHKVIAGYDFVDNDADPMDGMGHGTGLAGVIAASTYTFAGEQYQGLAPGVSIIALRTETEKGNDSRRVEEALQWVIDHRAQYNIVAVNLSIGTGDYSSPVSLQPYGDELATLASEGVFIAAASGNNGPQSPPAVEYPAADPNAFAIGSVDASGHISGFTERSNQLDLLAPGEDVPAIYYNPDTGQHIYLQATGTSFATPYAAAAAALLKQANPSLTPDQILKVLQDTGSPVRDSTTGLTFSLLNIDAALRQVTGGPDDQYEPNDTRSSAQFLNVSSGHTAISNLKLMKGNDDYFSFSLSNRSNVAITVNYSGGGSFPAGQLLDASGQSVASLNLGTHTQELAAGQYYLHFVSSQTLSGNYALDLSASTVAPPPPKAPQIRGTFNSIAYDNSGNLHVAWYDNAAKTLKYSEQFANGSWSSTIVVDKSPQAGYYVSLAIDASGRPGMAYYDNHRKVLKYAHFNGKTFGVSQVEKATNLGQYASLSYSKKSPVISYYDAGHGDLKFAMHKGKWSIKAIDTAGKTGLYTSIAQNPRTGGFGIAYENASKGLVRLAEQSSSGKWSIRTIDAVTTAAGGISLAYSDSGQASVSYYDARRADMKFAQASGKSWSRRTIASAKSQGRYSALVYSDGSPQLLYWNQSADALYLSRPDGGVKSVTRLTNGGGSYVSAAVAPNGQAVFFYRNDKGLLVDDEL